MKLVAKTRYRARVVLLDGGVQQYDIPEGQTVEVEEAEGERLLRDAPGVLRRVRESKGSRGPKAEKGGEEAAPEEAEASEGEEEPPQAPAEEGAGE